MIRGQPVSCGVAARYELLPEPIVETQIEQRSIHVQQHRSILDQSNSYPFAYHSTDESHR